MKTLGPPAMDIQPIKLSSLNFESSKPDLVVYWSGVCLSVDSLSVATSLYITPDTDDLVLDRS